MLVLTRRLGESISIGDDITVEIVGVKGRQVKLGISAPKSMLVYRSEIYKLIQDENRRAVGAKKDLVSDVAARIVK